MIIYLHGFDSNSPGNHEKVLQLQFIDPDVRLVSYSTRHPKHDMQHLLKEVDKMLQLNVDERPLICGVGLGGYWAERIWLFFVAIYFRFRFGFFFFNPEPLFFPPFYFCKTIFLVGVKFFVFFVPVSNFYFVGTIFSSFYRFNF
ncbi:hypothetical protein SEEA0100_14163 [Salmonella enterica subsp. enterica serovar Anatum str. USDA 100]|nr:hypothetical protein SEEA0100_14163 [Salmonella enterica subsp. enterica serovar Anatum str. USDA 100]